MSETAINNPSKEQIGEIFREAMGGEDTPVVETQQVEEPQEIEEVAEQETAPEVEDEQEVEEEGDEETLDPSQFSVTDLIEAFGDDVDPSKIYDVKVPMPDGAEPMSLGELKDAFVNANKTTKTLEQVQQEREQFEAERQQAQQYIQMMGQATERRLELQAMAYAVEQEEKAIDWDALAKQDSGAAAYRRQQIQEAKQAIGNEMQQVQQAEYQQQQQQYQQWAQNEFNQMMQVRNDWQNEDTRKSEYGETVTMLAKEYHLNDAEINALIDHRYLNAFVDLMKLKRAAGKAGEMKKQAGLRKPTALRGRAANVGQLGSGKQLRLKKLRAAEERGKKAVDLHDKASAISDILQLEGIK